MPMRADAASTTSWNSAFPSALVVACSDGRTNVALDAFLRADLQIDRYDRLYVPGGAGALAPGGGEDTRARRFQHECRFLIEAHRLKTVVLLFHGPASDGTIDALCGDYSRKFPNASVAEIRHAQDQDLVSILRLDLWHSLRVIAVRYEVLRGSRVHFVTLHDSAEPKQ